MKMPLVLALALTAILVSAYIAVGIRMQDAGVVVDPWIALWFVALGATLASIWSRV